MVVRSVEHAAHTMMMEKLRPHVFIRVSRVEA